MKDSLIRLLRCPDCRKMLRLHAYQASMGEIMDGSLHCEGCAAVFPIVRGVPRFVSSEGYTGSFGLEWNVFTKTQLDSWNGTGISRDRFRVVTGMNGGALRGQCVLDAGCGMGRFLEVAAADATEVVGIDMSNAVDAAYENLGSCANVHIVQADIFRLPFALETFDCVYSLGTLHHTPSIPEAMHALVAVLRSGGRIAAWIYHRYWEKQIPPFALAYRSVTTRMPKLWLLRLVRSYVPLALVLTRLPGVGRFLRWPLPVLDYRGKLPLSEVQLREWATLDTYDLLSPRYARYSSVDEVRRWGLERSLDLSSNFEPKITIRGIKRPQP